LAVVCISQDESAEDEKEIDREVALLKANVAEEPVGVAQYDQDGGHTAYSIERREYFFGLRPWRRRGASRKRDG
jgi:hypothetical protein